ncbi:exodeoxyribonuclease V subunit alpha [Thiocapsa imhoffii]|uniref:RecBCD enzyme subunit RecD n=2 Tax=Thiocapsa imhoffii TaxID=382777 RepID=A0A9X1BBL9_9GAMM|nr:exodeoxyribonuclease V subunit alpha [Thiocapsa imhoffii]
MPLSSLPPEAPVRTVLTLLERWVNAGALRPLDLALARFIADQGAEIDPLVLLAVALVSERNGHGHVCLDLRGVLEEPHTRLGHARDDQRLTTWVQEELTRMLSGLRLEDWVSRLAASSAVSDQLGRNDDDGVSPLVLAGFPERPLLYLRRYWQDENRIRAGLALRLERTLSVDETALRAQLERLFPAPAAGTTDAPNWQRIACALAARSAFFIITGGPGTGKTTTVVRLLALLQALAMDRGGTALRIALAAPTGKAAARLNESMTEQVQEIGAALGLTGRIPTQVKTLHRLLGTIPNSRRFRHHLANPLAADILVVDEASMVDIDMMARLLEALHPEARLILLGDKDQLSSVEAGAVLGDLCQRAARAHYRPALAQWLERASGERIPSALIDDAGRALDQSIVMLRKSYRFSQDGGIGALAASVNDATPTIDSAQRLTTVQRLFARDQAAPDQRLGTIRAIRLVSADDARFAQLIHAAYDAPESILRLMRDQAPRADADQAQVDDWARRILKAQQAFQLLTPLRQGPWGVEGLNARIITWLQGAGLLDPPPLAPPGLAAATRTWFAGRPVLVTRNDYGLNLMNGDMGITLARAGADAGAQPLLRVAFPSTAGGVRWIRPSRLQHVETVFALTVHKSQGSEFTHTALILPDQPNPVLTRELLYTAITRAKSAFTLLYPDEAVLAEALSRQVQRVSGLHELTRA